MKISMIKEKILVYHSQIRRIDIIRQFETIAAAFTWLGYLVLK